MDRNKNLSSFMRDSHAVDENGNPLRLYHGTADDFSEFKHGHKNKKDAGWLGRGFYFTNSPPMANSYAMLKPGKSENVMPVHLSLKNPFRATMEHKTALKNALMDDPYAAEDFRNKLIEAGHDGVILDYGTKDNVKEYVAFDPTQIKSATGNQGTFDPSNPDITKADGGGVKGYIPHNDERRAKNLANFHGETPEEIKTARWFHGTNKDFSSFQPRTANAIYVTQSPAFAQQFSKQHMENWHESAPEPPKGSTLYSGTYAKPKVHAPNIMPVHVRAEKPFDYENPKHVKDVLSTINHLGVSDVDRDLLARYLPIGDWESIESGPVQDVLKASGYDSFFVEEDGHKNLAVYKPEQLKSATGNQGTFDPSEPDITKADGGALTDDEDGITAYHGSPHDFDQFDINKIGTGEGAQAYGHGLYFAEAEPVAQGYRDRLSGYHLGDVKIGDETHPHWAKKEVAKAFAKLGYDPQTSVIAAHYLNEHKGDIYKAHGDAWLNENVPDAVTEALLKADYATPAGHMYEVHINAHPDHFADWDEPMSRQPEKVQKYFNFKPVEKPTFSVLETGSENPNWKYSANGHPAAPTPELALKNAEEGFQQSVGARGQFFHQLVKSGDLKKISKDLANLGVPGIKYLDEGSRGRTDKPTRNYVVFDHDHVAVKRKYAQGGVVG